MQQQLTPRQMEIFHLVAKGLSNREICELLGISANTVKIHVTSILRALDVSNRTEAVFAYKDMLDQDHTTTQAGQLRLADRLGRPAIAVLPFTDLQADSSGDYLLEGLGEELMIRLSAWQWFPVIAYASARRFDPADTDPQSISTELNARYLIYGSVRRKERHVRVTVRLVDTHVSQDIWSRSFNTTSDDLFALQDDIARQIVVTMAPELIHAEAANQKLRHNTSGNVWEMVSLGMWQLGQRTRESVEQANESFARAIEMDPDFSLAWHGKVYVLEVQVFEQWLDDAKAGIAELAAAAAECHRLAPTAAHGLTDRGLAAMLMGNAPFARDLLHRAVDLNPSSTRAFSLLAQVCGIEGDPDQCILHLEELLRLDPHSRSSARYRTIIGMCHGLAGRLEDCVSWSREALARDPNAT